MNKILFLFSVLFSFMLFSEEEMCQKEIVVSLATEQPLLSLYRGEFFVKNYSTTKEHYKELEKILDFDLGQNAVTLVTKGKAEEEKEIQKTEGLSLDFWRKRGYEYFLKTEIKGKFVSAYLVSTKSGLTYHLKNLKITNFLPSDRKIMHQIADFVYETITGKRGIARTRILFAMKTACKKGWQSEIWQADYDGANAIPLTEEKGYCITPAFFSAEGAFTQNRFVYVNYQQGQSKLYIASFNEKRGISFIGLRGNQLLPTFSVNGKMMAFVSDASGRADLFVQPFDPDLGPIGKPIQAYSFPQSVQASSTFRPDGKKIAFVSDKNGTPRIYMIDTPSADQRRLPRPICLTTQHQENTCPNWSPDGKKLAYSAKINGIRQIFIYNFLTREEMQLTSGKDHKENPFWAPDSLHLIFNTAGPSSFELFITNIKQKEMIQITRDGGNKHYPIWGPYAKE